MCWVEGLMPMEGGKQSMMLPVPAVAWLVLAAGARGDAVGLWDPGGTPGNAAGPSPALLASRLETSGSSIPAWGQAVLLGHTQGRALFPRQAPRCPGSTPGCRQQHCALVPPCMAGSQGGGEQALGAPSTRKAPQAAMPWLCPTCFPPSAASCIPPCKPPAPAHGPGLPKTAAILPPFLGDQQQVPLGPGLQLQAGAAFSALPQHRHRRRRFAAALPAPGRELAPAGVAD